MRYAIGAFLAVALLACSSYKPKPVVAGEPCFRCGRVITEPRLAAQLVTEDGQVSHFRTAACLARYLQTENAKKGSIYVTDYDSGELIQVRTAMFVRTTIDTETGERDFLAFQSVGDAAKRAKDEYSSVVDWSGVRTLVGMEKKAD